MKFFNKVKTIFEHTFGSFGANNNIVSPDQLKKILKNF